MKYFQVAFALCLSISLAASQYFGSHYSRFGGGPRNFGINSLAPDYSGAAAYTGNRYEQPIRDARQDRGPVVFPQPPADAPEESSGVIIGASGYGFVPPNSPQYRRRPKPNISLNLLEQSPELAEENEIIHRPIVDAFDPSSTSLGRRYNRYNRLHQRKNPYY